MNVDDKRIQDFKSRVESGKKPGKPRDPAVDEVGALWCCSGDAEAFWLYRAKTQKWSVEVVKYQTMPRSKVSEAERFLENLPPPPLPEHKDRPSVSPTFWFKDRRYCWIVYEGAERWQLIRVHQVDDPFGKAAHSRGRATRHG